MYNKKISFLIYFIFLAFNLFAQRDQNGQIIGRIVDGQSGESLPFVTVSLLTMDSLSLVKGGISDEQGIFRIDQIPFGSYRMEVQFIGFEKENLDIVVGPETVSVDLGVIKIFEDVEVLNEVEVTAERSTIEQKVDRKVINIGKDLATVGPTPADLMVNIPSVDVDQNGDISMRGNDNVIILVDGKPTNQRASQILQQIPSGSIQSIELITNPSAKYVPEGMSGIINIILRKNSNLGFNGTVTAGLTMGNERRPNVSSDLNYRARKVNFFANYALTDGPMPFEGIINRTDEGSDEIWFSLNDRTSQMIKTGLDYYAGEKTIVSFYSILNSFRNQSFRSTDILFEEVESSNFGQEYSSSIFNTTSTFNFDIKHQFSDKHKLEFEVDHSIFSGEEDADFDFYGSAFGVATAVEEIGSNRANTTVNLDYEGNITENQRLELGFEARVQRTDNSYLTTNPNFNGGKYDLDRNIYALYLNFSQQLGRWSYQLGARMEEFKQKSLFDENERVSRQFNDLIRTVYPTGFLTYLPDPESQRDAFNLSLSRRVDRPGLNQLNPMRAWSSARITNVGNPSLVPQFTNSVEFNYTRQLKTGSVTTGVFYRRIYDEITRFGFNDEENPGNILFSYDNYQNNEAFGVEFSGNIQLTEKWGVNASFDLYSQIQKGVVEDLYREVRNVLYNLRMNHSYKIHKNLTIQLIGLYRGANTNLQYRTLSYYFLNAGARYQLFEGKGTVSININDIFHTQRFAFEGERPVVQLGNYQWDSQSIFIGYTHSFGRGRKQAPIRRKRDSNEKKISGGF